MRIIFLKSYPFSTELINHGFYSAHLKNYLKYFEKENIHIGLVEDIKSNPLLTIQKLYNFLELNESYIPKFLNERPMASIYSFTRLKFRQFISSKTFIYTDNRKRMHKKEGFMYSILRVFLLLIDRVLLNKIFKADKPKVDNALKIKLKNIYEADIKELEKMTDKNLTNWYKNI